MFQGFAILASVSIRVHIEDAETPAVAGQWVEEHPLLSRALLSLDPPSLALELSVLTDFRSTLYEDR